MSAAFRLRQVWTIARLQLGRVFFSRRSLWVYLLAVFPVIPFLGHGVEVKLQMAAWSRYALPPAVLEAIQQGDRDEDILKLAPTPVNDFSFQQPLRQSRRKGRPREAVEVVSRRHMVYFDGTRRWNLSFENGILQDKSSRRMVSLEEDRTVFALVFQHFYLRLAVFFGCLGIFVNLFRGEMMDKTLHFWFLAPARREVLLGGKYLAGIIAAVTIFAAGSAMSYGALLWAQDASEAAPFWREQGLRHMLSYCASAALGAVGYGSVFLAAGLLLRNPIMPAIAILTWESVNSLLPAMLQKLSVLYYAQALTPFPAPTDDEAPLLIRLLTSPAEPPPALLAVVGLLAVTAGVLYVASSAVRRLEINYGSE